MMGVGGPAAAQEAPDAFVKRLTEEIIGIVRSDKEIQHGNQKHIADLIQKQVMPHVDFQRTTALAVGRYWRKATPEQQQRLMEEFRSLLLHTYAGAMSHVKNQQLEFKPLRANPEDSEVEVRFQVKRSRGGEPIQVSYRLVKATGGWKIYDVSVFGAWLVETYKADFAATLSNGGIDGLINALTNKNKKLAGGGVGAPKAL